MKMAKDIFKVDELTIQIYPILIILQKELVK